MRYEVHHRTTYTYEEPVSIGHYLARLAPLNAPGQRLLSFDPNERHEVRAKSDSRLLLLLAPWPGEGHPSRAA